MLMPAEDADLEIRPSSRPQDIVCRRPVRFWRAGPLTPAGSQGGLGVKTVMHDMMGSMAWGMGLIGAFSPVALILIIPALTKHLFFR